MSIDQSLIINDGLEALTNMRSCIDVLHAKRDEMRDRNEELILNEPDITRNIRELCLSQARAFKCLFDKNENRQPSETQKTRALRLARVDDFRKKCGNINIDQLSNRSARNGIIHFEEKYLRIISEEEVTLTYRYVALNKCSQLKAIDRAVILDQVYCLEDDTIYVLDGRLHVGKLLQELEVIVSGLGLRFEKKSEQV